MGSDVDQIIATLAGKCPYLDPARSNDLACLPEAVSALHGAVGIITEMDLQVKQYASESYKANLDLHDEIKQINSKLDKLTHQFEQSTKTLLIMINKFFPELKKGE